MQNIAQMIFPNQTSPSNTLQQTAAANSNSDVSDMSMNADLQNLLMATQNQSNQLDAANFFAALQSNQRSNSIQEQSSSNIANDFSSLLGLLGQQAMNNSRHAQESPSQMHENELNAMLALLTQQQQPPPQQQQQQPRQTSSPNTTSASLNNNFLEQLQMLNNAGLNVNTSQNNSNSNGYPFNYGSPSKDSWCDLCEKNVCNRYFLKTHMQKKHGIYMTDAPETPAKQLKLDSTQSPVINGADGGEDKSNDSENKPSVAVLESMLANVIQGSMGSSGDTNQDLLSLLKQIGVPNTTPVKSSQPDNTERFSCEQCDKDFSSQFHLGQHRLTHTSAAPTSSSSATSASNILSMLPQGLAGLPFMLPMNSPFVKMDMDTPSFTNLSPITSLNNSLNSKPSQKRQYSSTSKNFCEICKKDVCNKYFLRTHMLKMHNIVIDENKILIANIDTQEKEKEGSVTFRCDVCSFDLKSRTELRDHKRDIHGIQPLITPNSAISRSSSSSTASKPCSTANSAIGTGTTQGSGPAFLFPPSTTESADSPPPSTAGMNEVKCSKCDLDYSSIESLIEHINNEHNEMNQTDIVEMLKESTSSMPLATKCNQCDETFETAFSLQVHNLKEHQNEDADEAMRITQEVAMKMAVENQRKKLTSDGAMLKSPKASFTCSKCSRAYSTKSRLDEHVSSVHQYSVKMSPKKCKLVLSPTKVNKMIKSFSCLKCHQRFSNSELCKIHIMQHLKAETAAREEQFAGSSSAMSVDEHKENKTTDFDENLIQSYIREDCTQNDKPDLAEEHRESNGKSSEEKHSHTSGSASPMSVTVPEGYAIPLNDDNKKPYTLQSFVMRELSDNTRFITELQAYLPVLSTITEPITVTFELSPLPQLDAQMKNNS